MAVRVIVPRERGVGERRVALTPEIAARLVKAGFDVRVEAGAGEAAGFANAAYEGAGAKVLAEDRSSWQDADIVAKVGPPLERDGRHEADVFREGAVLIAFLNPRENRALLERLSSKKITAFSVDQIPRLSRAQSMDALSSQASVAGYKAVLIAAQALPKFFPMLTTAAGTVAPAKVLVVGAGVAGLQAIATARRLGAVVEAFDIRPAAKEEVESLGARFISVEVGEQTVGTGGYAKEVSEAARRKEHEGLAEHVQRSDVVITTAQVPGKRAPLLITEAMVRAMAPGSVIVDLAAEQGGNCALTQPGKEIAHQGITIIGPVNVPSSMPVHASQMFARNIWAFLQLLVRDGAIRIDLEDEIFRASCVTHAGEIRWKD